MRARVVTLTSHPSSLERCSSARASGASRVVLIDFEVVAGTDWDRLVSGFDGICQEQLHCYARLRWPGVALEPMVFTDAGRVIGGVLVMLQPLPGRLATMALCKWGPMLADMTAANSLHLMERMAATLVAEYAEKRGMMVSIMPRVEPGAVNRVSGVLERLGFSQGVNVRHPMRYVVDVRLDDDARMAAFSQKWRYNLRKAMKAGLTLEKGGPQDFDRFMALYKAMSERKMFPDHSGIATAGSLMDMPDGTARPELFFVTHEGETVAGAMIFSAGETACYLYGATNDAALDLRAGYFVHWHIIRWLRDNTSARYYDLGGTDGFAGLHQFKSGMVGEAGYMNDLPPVFNYASHWRARLAGLAAYKARDVINAVRDLAIAGRLGVRKLIKPRKPGA